MDELNVLKEVGSIAAGHGGIALSEILGRKISLSVPAYDIISKLDRSEKIRLDTMGVVIFSRILVGLKGEVVFILSEENAFKLMKMASPLTSPPGTLGIPTEIGMSILREVGSIVMGSYLNALGLMLKRMIIPPLPTLINGALDDIMDLILAPYSDQEFSYMIETEFKDEVGGIKGSFHLILTPTAAKDINDTLDKMLKDLEK